MVLASYNAAVCHFNAARSSRLNIAEVLLCNFQQNKLIKIIDKNICDFIEL
jgi:hypothetical protein